MVVIFKDGDVQFGDSAGNETTKVAMDIVCCGCEYCSACTAPVGIRVTFAGVARVSDGGGGWKCDDCLNWNTSFDLTGPYSGSNCLWHYSAYTTLPCCVFTGAEVYCQITCRILYSGSAPYVYVEAFIVDTTYPTSTVSYGRFKKTYASVLSFDCSNIGSVPLDTFSTTFCDWSSATCTVSVTP